MFRQLFVSAALATAFSVSPALAGDHEQDAEGEATTYDRSDRAKDSKEVTPDREAYDAQDKGSDDGKENAPHPAHKMGEGDPAKEQGQ